MTISADIADCFNFGEDALLTGRSALYSKYDIPALANACLAAVGLATSDLLLKAGLSAEPARVTVDRRLALRWFALSLQPVGWTPPPIWDDVAGDYRTKDGWIKLHTNSPEHKKAACNVLQEKASPARFSEAIRHWNGEELETELHDAGGVGATMRSRAEWIAHPQGASVRKEPIVIWEGQSDQPVSENWRPTLLQPLKGLKVLDLTRILAGPSSTRTLAGLGAHVLRIDPPGWNEPNVEHEITLGKNCTRLDLRSPEHRKEFETLLRDADLLVHGYRPGALGSLGFGEEWRMDANPRLREVTINAYGWSGPWSGRRGYDSLVQMSSGLAHDTMTWQEADKPVSQPVPALDYAAGYLMAASAIHLLAGSISGAPTRRAKLSLARVAELLMSQTQSSPEETDLNSIESDFNELQEMTDWGPGLRLKSPITVGDCQLQWTKPACSLGSDQAVWPTS